ncbi:MAG TPA: DUF4129 domain-containing protein [Candidatus Poseidoniales archaeon]|nr:DUF4129 domain-containing protein [Candidatus Poseidoniales archaeon]
MLSNRQYDQKINQRRKSTVSVGIVLLMITSTWLAMIADLSEPTSPDMQLKGAQPLALSEAQSTDQGGQGEWDGGMSSSAGLEMHDALWDLAWADPGAMYGTITDHSILDLNAGYGLLLEESRADDHDNDGINDLDDLDDDNDGIYDLLERFDGCFGTDPYDHDNDGVLDIDDWDDDNDGILEGPLDYDALEAQGLDPRNVSMHRYLDSSIIHPLTGSPVGIGYRADQLPYDHDNDGVPDEDSDGSGSGRYDEDDDNDGRIDQFRWPCDFDNDGAQDYFDDDDDNDGVLDVDDENPYDASVTTLMSASGNDYNPYRSWSFNEYRTYSAGVNFITLEASRVDANDVFDFDGGTTGDGAAGTPAFTNIVDGDLDGDGIPNFIDPDNDNDGTPDSADTDDDNDGLLDMWDPDDDNDGIPDTCWNIDMNGDGLNDYTRVDTSPYQTPGANTDGIAGIDCEMDYDADLDDDRWRPFDKNYNAVWDWLDPDMGGNPTPDDAVQTELNALDFAYDMDDDQVENENDSFPLDKNSEAWMATCPSMANPNPTTPDTRCMTRRASFSQFNDWDGDGISNWDDVDDDGDGIIDMLDIDWDCDFDNDADLHAINGSKYRDDGPNDVDSDIDGDGLPNDIDWDDDNDGLTDLYDPDDGNCGLVDFDTSDAYATPYYPIGDGAALDGSSDDQAYADNTLDYWSLVFTANPFADVVLNYNGYDATTSPPTGGTVPEFYWFMYTRWSAYNGGNEWDIDADGDSLINGIDTDQDGDGMPDWWDQDEGNDGLYDVDDPKMGGTINMTSCGWTVGNLGTGYTCGYSYAVAYHMPLTGTNANWGSPYSTRPDAVFNQGNFAGSGGNNDWSCTAGALGGCWHYDFGGDGSTDSAISYTDITNNRDAFLTWIGLDTGAWQWNFDGPNSTNTNFPDELGADLVKNDVDGDTDGDFTNDSVDLDDDYDSLYDFNDVDDDNDGLWDYFEVDSDDDLDNDDGQDNGNFFNGTNCNDNDDDGNDQDVDGDGWFQAVWDKGKMSQGLKSPKYYDVDNDNDGVPDSEDFDDDNNGVPDTQQELMAGCFEGEEQHPFDHDNDGIVDWADDDFDGDGIPNLVEAAISITAPFDHDNDGTRDDIDDDDDEDGMRDVDEVLLWPLRFDAESTNPWDHDDYGQGTAIANPLDPSTGPDAIDNDDDDDGRIDSDWDHLEEGETSDPCYSGSQSSDWDHNNDCKLDADDKAPTFITMNLPDTLWLDAQSPSIFSGHVDWINPVSSTLEPAQNLPVQVHIEWTGNNTTAIETIDVLTNQWGNFTVGQFLYPESLVVGDNTTYRVFAEVTEMFAFNGNQSQSYMIGCQANLTVDYSAWTYFRSDEQPFWLDFKAHYVADWSRGFYDNRVNHAPITFEIVGGPFGNRSVPSNYSGFGGDGYRTDDDGWASLTFIQNLGANGTWKQVRWNSTMDNGVGIISGGYEEIVWNDLSKTHDILVDGAGVPLRYNYTNTSLPAGDIEITAFVNPSLADEWPFPYLNGDSTDPFPVRIMHRMNIEGEMVVNGTNAVYYWDGTVNNGDGTFGNWATLFNEQALDYWNVTYAEAKVLKPYPSLWDGNLSNLTGEATRLRGFIRVDNNTNFDWRIALVNGGDSDLPPCGPIDPTDPSSPIRCEIVPEMNTGDSLEVNGTVTNRTHDAWDQDPIALQVDIDHNGEFAGSQETAYTQRPVMKDGNATFEYNWTWYSQYPAGTYGLRVDFTNNAYYFTGNSTTLATTGAYINVTIVGTTQFQMTSVPRLYRNTSTIIEARLLDNSLQPVKGVPVSWAWSFDGRSGVNFTDDLGIFAIPFDINPGDSLGNYTLQFEYEGDRSMKGNIASQSVWVVSRTYLNVISADPNIRQSGDRWDFTAQVTDDNKTATIRDSGGLELSGPNSPNGGLIDVIFEGQDFEGVMHRQVIATLSPNAGLISLPEPQPDKSHLCFYDGNGDGIPDRDANGNNDGQLDDDESIGCLKANVSPLSPQLLREDPDSFLPDGFGPVTVYLRFRETLPHEGCGNLDPAYLSMQGKWDPCVDLIGNDHFRIQMAYNANGFSVIGRTSMDVDDQIVYTSEIDPLTGEVVSKPMIVTGKLTDELNTNLTYRNIRVNYEMVNSPAGPVACISGMTDYDGNFAITCPLSDVTAGVARVSVIYSAWDNNDAYRYQNKTVQTEFAVFSNSTLHISEVGPFKSSVETFVAANGTAFPVLYLKESFHIDAALTQSNGQFVGGKCLNIYLDPAKNVRPLSSISTRESNGLVEWFSGDPSQNPTLKGVETTGGELEGFRLLRVAFEPTLNVPGGCDKDTSNVLNGSSMDVMVLVRSRVDLQVKTTWSHSGENGLDIDQDVIGEIALLRDRLDLAVESEEIWFVRQYWDRDANEWVTEGKNESFTNEQGVAGFTWKFAGNTCEGEPCDGEWRIIAYYPGSTFFAESTDNITHEVHYQKANIVDQSSGIFTPSTIMALVIILLGGLIAGVMYYQRVVARRQVEALRGILTDTMLQLQAANEYIAIIFDCYKQLVKHFRRHGFMKKVYETTREFESAVRDAFHMVPADQLDGFIAIFEEARYSDHEIGESHRDRATQTLGAITQSLAMALGDGGMITRGDGNEAKLYGNLTKAGEFVAADGTVKQAGIDEDAESTNFKI